MQLTAAGGQSQQLSKALMKDYHDFMNEDSGIMFKKQVKEKKTQQTKPHNTRSPVLSSYKWPITHSSPRQQYHKTWTFWLLLMYTANAHSQILDLGIKRALACLCVRTRQNGKAELFQMQTWPVGSWSILVYSSHACKRCGERDSKFSPIQSKRLKLKRWQELLS